RLSREATGAGGLRSSRRTITTVAKANAERVIEPATRPRTPRVPIEPISGPAALAPSGPASVATVITAAITFGRNASGVLIVSAPRTGAFTSGFEAPKIASATTNTATGAFTVRAQSGSTPPTNANVASLNGATRVSSLMAAATPKIAPALVAAT